MVEIWQDLLYLLSTVKDAEEERLLIISISEEKAILALVYENLVYLKLLDYEPNKI